MGHTETAGKKAATPADPVFKTLKMLPFFPADPENPEDAALLNDVFQSFSQFVSDKLAEGSHSRGYGHAHQLIDKMYRLGFEPGDLVEKTIGQRAISWYVRTLEIHLKQLDSPLSLLCGLSLKLGGITNCSDRERAAALVCAGVKDERPSLESFASLGTIAREMSRRLSDRSEHPRIHAIAADCIFHLVENGALTPDDMRSINSRLADFYKQPQQFAAYAGKPSPGLQDVWQKVADTLAAMAPAIPVMVSKPVLAQAIRRNLRAGPV